MEGLRFLVSIIVPVYNVENYVERCLLSLLNQTYKNLEILIVNDCSTDSSLEICKSIAERDTRVQIFSNKVNVGISSTRNVGLERISGEYVIFVDSDDFLDKNFIEIMLEEAISSSSDLISCGFQYYRGETIQPIHSCNFRHLCNEDAFLKMLNDQSNYCAVWAKIYKKSVIGSLRFPEGNRFGEDMAFTPYVIINAHKIMHTDTPMYYYSQEGVSLVRSGFNPNRLNMIDQIKNWLNLCQKKYPNLINGIRVYLIFTMLCICTLTLDDINQTYYNKVKSELKNEAVFYLTNKSVSIKEKVKLLLVLLFPRKTNKYLRKIFGLKN